MQLLSDSSLDILAFISQPWHWAVSGIMIVLVMALLLWFGGEFGVSSNLRTLCAIGGAGKVSSFFSPVHDSRYNFVASINVNGEHVCSGAILTMVRTKSNLCEQFEQKCIPTYGIP